VGELVKVKTHNLNISQAKGIKKRDNASVRLSKVFTQELPSYFTHDEIEKLFSDVNKERYFPQYVLCLFLYLTGVRVSEALSVMAKDLDFKNGSLRVKTLKRKNHARVLPTPQALLGDLAVWMVQKKVGRNDQLFGFNRQTAYYHVRKLCEVSDIDKEKAHPHVFRHTYAVRLVTQQVPLPVVQQMLGHADITKTLIYTKITANDIKAYMNNVSFFNI